MYLSKIEIQGFKSFARKTVFEFPEQSSHDKKAKSITAIVGPNGSGKSNVSDSIRWVLGEQSLKLIRCKKADDVIFGGSEKKARQGFAEVSLYMNNEDKELPIEFSEVVLTRRVFRTGENEYLINKRSVRLYDILILLAKSNFGQRSYSIVGQGMVDHIINISAFERKEFFDEATGVKQYQIKRDQAVNRLRRSRENLDETNKILAELEPRLRLLTKQIKKLEQRQGLEVELKALQTKYYGHQWTKLQVEREKQSALFAIQDGLRQEALLRLNQVQTELAVLAKEESRKDIFNNYQKDYNKLNNEKSELLKEMAMVNGKMSLEYVKFGKQNLSWLESKKDELVKRIQEINESANNLKNKLEFKNKNLAEKEALLAERNRDLVVAKNNLESAESDLLRLKSGSSFSGGYEAVRALLRQRGSIKGILGTVSDLASIEPIYETALATIAGNRLAAVVVQNEEVAVQCINYLKDHRLGTATFFPLNKIEAHELNSASRALLVENGAIGFATELINFDPKYKKVFHLVFGSTIVMDTLENAKALGVGREKMVTLDGDVLEKTGVMRGGFRAKERDIWGIFDNERKMSNQEERMRDIALLRSKMDNLMNQSVSLQPEITDLKVEIQFAETKAKGLGCDLEDLIKEKDKIIAEIEENKIAPADQDVYLKNLNSKKAELERVLEGTEKKLTLLRTKLDEFNLEEERKKEAVFKLQNDMQSYQGELNEVSILINNININLAKLETKKEDLEKEALQELGSDYHFEKISEEHFNLDELWFNISKLRQNLEQIGGIDPEIVAEHKEVSERYEFLNKQGTDLDKAILDLEKVVSELDEIINKQFDVSFKKINKAFEKYFTKVFGGGKAKLELVQREPKESSATNSMGETVMVEAGDEMETEEVLPEKKSRLLNTGIEIMVAPPNKKINHIASLSGGERTMTSLALICAIIESNPAPFIVMDEVDAALDESNSEKFSIILQELSYKSQFVVITHNRVIMHVADVLFGVAMGDDGVSSTLSIRLEDTVKQEIKS